MGFGADSNFGCAGEVSGEVGVTVGCIVCGCGAETGGVGTADTVGVTGVAGDCGFCEFGAGLVAGSML